MGSLSFRLSKAQMSTIAVASVDTNVSDINDIVFVLALDTDPDLRGRGWTVETIIDRIVKFAQPSPAVAHVELMFPPIMQDDNVHMHRNNNTEMHFATYFGARAGFGSAFNNQRDFYLGKNAARWRAVPISLRDASSRLRSECNAHVNTEYTLLRYICSVPPLRSLTTLLSAKPGDLAHCATLTTRCLRRAFPEMKIKHPSAWYGPATLMLELECEVNCARTRKRFEDSDHYKSVGEDEELSNSMAVLLHGSDDDIHKLSNDNVCNAIFALSYRAVQTGLDIVARRIVQKQLATALLRVSCSQFFAKRS